MEVRVIRGEKVLRAKSTGVPLPTGDRLMYVNARAIIERQTAEGVEILIQTRNKSYEKDQCLELPGGCVEEYESLIAAPRREVWEETGLELSEIEGVSTKIDIQAEETNVECFQAFSVYQTTTGPVDSMGVCFRCKATGELVDRGDGAEHPRWVSVRQLAQWIIEDAGQFSWVDRAGMLFYLKHMGAVEG